MDEKYLLLLLIDSSDVLSLGKKAVKIASVKGLGLVVMYISREKIIEKMIPPSIRRGVVDRSTLLYTFTEKVFREDLVRVSQMIEELLPIVYEKKIKLKTIIEFKDPATYIKKRRNVFEMVVTGYVREEYRKLLEDIQKKIGMPILTL
ncbi:MAG: hypothetical protein QXD35_04840 [Nitrososphaerota archaeon]